MGASDVGLLLAMLTFFVRKPDERASSAVRKPDSFAPPDDDPDAPDFMWPLPVLQVGYHDGSFKLYRPVVSDPWGPGKRKNPDGTPRLHAGADIAYKADERTRVRWNPGGRDHSKGNPSRGFMGFFLPSFVPVLAARAGRVWTVKTTKRGTEVTVVHDHGHRATWYQHLATVDVFPGEDVAQGARLGTAGFDPSGNAFRHLHFETWTWDAGIGTRGGFRKVDPGDERRGPLAGWAVAPVPYNVV